MKCRYCNGTADCAFCGDKVKKHKIDEKKEEVTSFYSVTNAKLDKFNMDTTQSTFVDAKAKEQHEWEQIHIVQERVFFKRSLKAIAKAESISVKLVKEILARHGHPEPRIA